MRFLLPPLTRGMCSTDALTDGGRADRAGRLLARGSAPEGRPRRRGCAPVGCATRTAGASCDPGVPVTPYVQCDHVTPTDVVATAQAEGNRSGGTTAGRALVPPRQPGAAARAELGPAMN